MSYGKIWLTTVAVSQDLLSGMPLVLKIELIRLWNSILPEPGQPSAQLSKLIRPTLCKNALHAMRRWYRTVYIPWLVTSYDTHKGKRWQNSKSPKPKGVKTSLNGFLPRGKNKFKAISLNRLTNRIIIAPKCH